MLETELNTECVLAREGVWISETFRISTAVPGDGEYILGLEIYPCVLQEKFVLDVSGNGIS